jgi:hypothetical protein
MSDRPAPSAPASGVTVSQLDIYRVLIRLGEWLEYDSTIVGILENFYHEIADDITADIAVAALASLQKSGDVAITENGRSLDVKLTKLGRDRSMALKQLQEGH